MVSKSMVFELDLSTESLYLQANEIKPASIITPASMPAMRPNLFQSQSKAFDWPDCRTGDAVGESRLEDVEDGSSRVDIDNVAVAKVAEIVEVRLEIDADFVVLV